ncbi:hypothetical protein TNCV_2334051 [Trichonephila clavipes]|nr:hypothetical protein TNCV_2334051 [Trichonephila clavipes]
MKRRGGGGGNNIRNGPWDKLMQRFYQHQSNERTRQQQQQQNQQAAQQNNLSATNSWLRCHLEVLCPLRKLNVPGSNPAGDEIFSGCDNRRHACHGIMWHVKYVLGIKFGSGTHVKLNHGNI